MRNPCRYFNSSPEVISLAVMMYVRYPLSLRQVEDLLFERGIDIYHETVRYWWTRFGPPCIDGLRSIGIVTSRAGGLYPGALYSRTVLSRFRHSSMTPRRLGKPKKANSGGCCA